MLISWNLTKKCNLYCDHCYRESGPEADCSGELDTAAGKRLLGEIKAAGFRMVIFSGGEPLLRDDLCELAAHAAGLGLRPALGTNGILLSAEVAAALRDAGIAGVAVSLDSRDSAYHDRFRNAPGAWEAAVRGIRNALAAGLRVQINTTLTGNNFDQFPALTDFAAELGVQALHPFFLVPTGRGRNLAEDALKSGQYFRMIETILEKQKESAIELKPTCAPQFIPMAKEMGLAMRFTRGCLAGVAYCCILPDGEVHVCPYLPVTAGNVTEQPFDAIWRDSGTFRALRDYQAYQGRCGQCADIGSCGGCRARAYYYSGGDYLAEEPWCFRG
jgi:putative heme d1 biosynthesis radical SAM protein NirJ2